MDQPRGDLEPSLPLSLDQQLVGREGGSVTTHSSTGQLRGEESNLRIPDSESGVDTGNHLVMRRTRTRR